MLENTDNPKYIQEHYRFVILITYIAAALVNSLPVHTFSSINVAIEKTFQLTSFEVTFNALLFTIAHPLFALPCNWIINKFGMRISFIIGAAFVVTGVWLRIFLDVGAPVFCLMGSGIAAIGNIFILNTPSKIAINWFGKERVNIVTFTGILASLLSITAGAAVPGLIIDDHTSVQDVKTFLLVQAIIVTFPLVLLACFFRETPRSPPSKAAKMISDTERINYKDLLKTLFKNKQYLKLMIAMTFSYGTLTALIMIVDQMLAGLGYKDNSGEFTSITIASAMIAGIISNPVFSYLLRITKAYRAVSALNTFGGLLMATLLLQAFIQRIQVAVEIMFLGAMLGFFLIPLPSILISYSSEVVFPIDQSSSAGYLFASSQTFGFLIGFLSILFLDKAKKQRSEIICYIYMGFLSISLLAAVWVKEDLKKWKFQQSAYESKSATGLEASLIVQEEGLK